VAAGRSASKRRLGAAPISAVLIDHWGGTIDGGDLVERLRPLPHD